VSRSVAWGVFFFKRQPQRFERAATWSARSPTTPARLTQAVRTTPTSFASAPVRPTSLRTVLRSASPTRGRGSLATRFWGAIDPSSRPFDAATCGTKPPPERHTRSATSVTESPPSYASLDPSAKIQGIGFHAAPPAGTALSQGRRGVQ